MKGDLHMAKGIIVPQDKRNEIIAKIRDEGMTVTEADRQYDISPKTIYSWMRDGVANSSTKPHPGSQSSQERE
jgi:transposase-like protein